MELATPQVLLSGVPFLIKLSVPAFFNVLNGSAVPLPTSVSWRACVEMTCCSGNATDVRSTLAITASGLVPAQLGVNHVSVDVWGSGGFETAQSALLFCIPGVATLLPPIVTLIVSVLFQQVLLSLLLGVFVGAMLLNSCNPIVALLNTFSVHIVDSLSVVKGHAGVLVMTMVLSGWVALIQRNGGTEGCARAVQRCVRGPLSGQLCTIMLGCCIFFDDYSSILIVGNTLRPLLTQLRIPRAKFAHIVHSLGVCFASFSPVSSWVGVELGYIGAGIPVERAEEIGSPFTVLLKGLPLRFFPILVFCLCITTTLFGDAACIRDVEDVEEDSEEDDAEVVATGIAEEGTADESAGVFDVHADENLSLLSRGDQLMDVLVDETNAEGEADEPEAAVAAAAKASRPSYWWQAAVPIVVVVLGAFSGMLIDGMKKSKQFGLAPTIVNSFAKCDSISALIWANLAGLIVALMMSVVGKPSLAELPASSSFSAKVREGGGCAKLLGAVRSARTRCRAVQEAIDGMKWIPKQLLGFNDAMATIIEGMQELLEPIIVLLLAWALGTVVADVGTAQFIAQALNSGNGATMPAAALAPIAALMAIVTSFATGSSFGTMGILFPLVLPLALELEGNGGNAAGVIEQCSAAILGFAIFGNCCSPIADTTILTSVATGVDMAVHVRTTLGYTVAAAGVALLGTIATSLGTPVWVALPVAIVALCGGTAMVVHGTTLFNKIQVWYAKKKTGSAGGGGGGEGIERERVDSGREERESELSASYQPIQ